MLSQDAATVVRGLLQARVGGRPYSERMLGQVVCMTHWMQEQRAELGFSDKGLPRPVVLVILISSPPLVCTHKAGICIMLRPCPSCGFGWACTETNWLTCMRAAWLRNRQMREQPGLKDPRAILLLAYQHREPPMSLPKRITCERSPLMDAMHTAIKSGLEIWQVSTACRLQTMLWMAGQLRAQSLFEGHCTMIEAGVRIWQLAKSLDAACAEMQRGRMQRAVKAKECGVADRLTTRLYCRYQATGMSPQMGWSEAELPIGMVCD